MSLWIERPTLLDLDSGGTLLVFRDANWSLDAAQWIDDAVVALTLRKYPGSHVPGQLHARVDCLARSAEVAGRVATLAQLEDLLDRSLVWPREDSAQARTLLDRLLGRS